jgi:hypothetical protein
VLRGVLRTFRAAGTADYLASGGRIEIVRLMAEGTRAPKLRVCMAGATMTSAAGESSGSGFDDNSVANPARPQGSAQKSSTGTHIFG